MYLHCINNIRTPTQITFDRVKILNGIARQSPTNDMCHYELIYSFFSKKNCIYEYFSFLPLQYKKIHQSNKEKAKKLTRFIRKNSNDACYPFCKRSQACCRTWITYAPCKK